MAKVTFEVVNSISLDQGYHVTLGNLFDKKKWQ